METLKDGPSQSDGSTSDVAARNAAIDAALADARQRRQRGDTHGARELALSILAVKEDHLGAAQLLAALELASLPQKPRPARPAPAAVLEPPPPAAPAAAPVPAPVAPAVPAASARPAPPPTSVLIVAPRKRAAESDYSAWIRVGIAGAVLLALVVTASLAVVRFTTGRDGRTATPASAPAEPALEGSEAAPPASGANAARPTGEGGTPNADGRPAAVDGRAAAETRAAAAVPPPIVASAPPLVEAPSSRLPAALPDLRARQISRRVDESLSAGDFGTASRVLSDALRSYPSDPLLRNLQHRVDAAARRAADRAETPLREARGAAEKARALELARPLYDRARELESGASQLYRRQLWTDALAKRREAQTAYKDAQGHARVEQSRRAYEAARTRAMEAGAPRLAADRFNAGQARSVHAQGLVDGHEFDGSATEFDAAASLMEAARRAAVDAAAADRRAALPAPGPAATNPASSSTSPAGSNPAAANPAPGAPNTAPSTAAGLAAARAREAEADREAILALVRRYVAAMEARDMGALKAVWPTLGGEQESKIRASFDFARSLRVHVDVAGVRINDATALVSAYRQDAIVTKEGQNLQSERRPSVIKLEKSHGWTITSIQ